MKPRQIQEAIIGLSVPVEQKTMSSIEYPDLACTYYMSARALVEFVAEVERQCAARIVAGISRLGEG